MDDINQATEPMQLSEDSVEKSVGTANDKDGGDESPLPELTPKGTQLRLRNVNQHITCE